MNQDLIIKLLIVAVIYLFYLNFSNKNNIEKMSNSSTIKNEINQIYNADVQAIRNLAEISQKLQRGTLTIPGNLTVKGSLNVNGKTQMNNDLTFANAKSIRGHRLHIAPNEKLYLLPKGGVHITKDWGSSGHVYANSLDIKGKHGTTHFNYANKGQTYLRDNVYVYDYIQAKRLDIKSGRGTTHLNYAGRGDNYFRAGTNHLDGTTTIRNIRTRQHGGEVTPGDGHWGDWHGYRQCPKGQFMTGARVRIERNQHRGDDTAMNGIRFKCSTLN